MARFVCLLLKMDRLKKDFYYEFCCRSYQGFVCTANANTTCQHSGLQGLVCCIDFSGGGQEKLAQTQRFMGWREKKNYRRLTDQHSFLSTELSISHA